jgi:hypothetical protein
MRRGTEIAEVYVDCIAIVLNAVKTARRAATAARGRKKDHEGVKGSGGGGVR